MTQHRVARVLLLLGLLLIPIDAAVERSVHAVLLAVIETALAVVLLVGPARGRRSGR